MFYPKKLEVETRRSYVAVAKAEKSTVTLLKLNQLEIDRKMLQEGEKYIQRGNNS